MFYFFGFCLVLCVLLGFFRSRLFRVQEGVEEEPKSDNNAPQIKYDVFVSFSGEIRCGFLSHLVNAFKSKKINVFVDERLEKGDEIWPSLVEAIEGSFISLIIFSPKYAFSRWCLQELVTILDTQEKYGGTIIPVFYDVEPTNVRHQSGIYKKAVAKLGRRYNFMMKTWRDALSKAAGISGIDLSKFQNDAELVKEIVKVVLLTLDKSSDRNSKGFAVIDKRIEYVESLIHKEPEHTRVIGIWGMGGIGKTILAEKIFNKLRSKYDGYYFLENEGENYNKSLKKFFSKLLRFDVEIDIPNLLPNIVWRIHQMKVLIVVDDVNDSELLEKLLEALYNFRSGSRIIVTTRDKHLLNKANEIYPFEEYNVHEALQLFNMYAFKQSDHRRDYSELSKMMVHYAKGIPLVLTVLARRLCGKDKEVWESELHKLNKMPPAKVYDVMKLSYDDVEHEEQETFLDLACFILRLLGKVKVDNLKSLLKDEERDMSVVGRLARLRDKCLITCSEDNFISMHDSLQEMGQEIVRRESRKDPGSCSWLWNTDDICEALKNDKGTMAIRSVQIDFTKIKKRELSPGLFTRMSGLKFLEIKNGSYPHNIQLEGLQLRFLSWDSYPLTSLPNNFSAEKLVMLKLQGSKMQKLWDGVKNLVNLKEVDLSQSKMLNELPNFSKATNLEILILNSCFKLTDVDPYILSLPKLEKLDLSNCMKLTRLTSDSGLCSLSDLKLDNCRNLREFSVISKNMKELRFRNTILESLYPAGSNIEISSPFNNLTQLLSLELTNCKKLQTIPELPQNLKTLDIAYCRLLRTITNLPPSIETLNVRDGKSLQSLPELPQSLETLDVQSCSSLRSLPELPESLKTLDVSLCISLQILSELPQFLETLDVQSCSSLQILPELPESLKTLDVSFCTSLQTLPELPQSLEILEVQSCSSLHCLPDLPKSLETLDVSLCISLRTLSELPQSLETLDVQSCSSLQRLPKLPMFLRTLDYRKCCSLQSLPELPRSLETVNGNRCTSL